MMLQHLFSNVGMLEVPHPPLLDWGCLLSEMSINSILSTVYSTLGHIKHSNQPVNYDWLRHPLSTVSIKLQYGLLVPSVTIRHIEHLNYGNKSQVGTIWSHTLGFDLSIKFFMFILMIICLDQVQMYHLYCLFLLFWRINVCFASKTFNLHSVR